MTVVDGAVPHRAGPARNLAALAWISAGFCAGFIMAGLVDARLLDGVSVWRKPQHFAASFVIYFATLSWVAAHLSCNLRRSVLLRRLTAGVAFCFVAELGYIAVQASRAEASHFNAATPFHSLMYTLMGVGAVALVIAVAAMGVMVARDTRFRTGPRTRQGIVWGFLITLPLTLIVAGYMGSNGSHAVGVPPPGAAVLPIMGWSLAVGDLRPAHFVALHAMQALPLLGFALDRSGRGHRAIIPVAALIWSALCLALFGQALMGLPLFRV